MTPWTCGLVIACALLAPQPSPVTTARIKILTTRALATVLHEVGPQFEAASGHTLDVSTDIAIRMVRRVDAGEPFDVLVAAPAQIDNLIGRGLIAAGSRTVLARSGIGVEVRAGAPRPDISSVEAFKRALIEARSIAFLAEGQSGVYLAGLIDRLGLSDALRSKTIRPEADIVSELVANGDVELGMVVITQILTTPGVQLVGPLPADLQSYIEFTGGVGTASTVPDAAGALLRFLTGPAAARVMRAQGMEPGGVRR